MPVSSSYALSRGVDLICFQFQIKPAIYGNDEKLKIGAFQFEAGDRIENNLAAIKRGIMSAAWRNASLLLTQESALCGYPSMEVPSARSVDNALQLEAYREISKLAKRHNMYIALGMITF